MTSVKKSETAGAGGGALRARSSAQTNNRASALGFRGSVITRNPQVTRYQDHFSLQAPTSVVRFADSKSAARVIYMEGEGKQLVIEERRDSRTNKRHITIKQMQEEAGGGLRLLRLLYSLTAAFFMGFLAVFAVQVLLLVIFDLAIYTGYTDINLETTVHTNYALAVGVFFALPILIHGFALMMMMANFFVQDLWQGHYFFKKFVLPALPDQIIEWVFLLGMLICPLLVIAALLFAKNDQWWAISSFYWVITTLVFYMIFVISVLVFEARIYLQIVQDKHLIRGYDSSTTLGSISACIALRKRNTLSGYSHTSYSSFGSISPDQAFFNSNQDAISKHIIQGTLRQNQCGLYSRLTQWKFLQQFPCLHLYDTLDTPKRIYSVDDVTGRRPYVTSVTWGLEKLFCRPRKNRYVSLLNGPFSITKAHLMSALICSFLGVTMTYIMVAAILVYQGFDWSETFVALVAILLVSFPCWLTPIKQYWEFRKLEILQEEFYNNNNNNNNNVKSPQQEKGDAQQPAEAPTTNEVNKSITAASLVVGKVGADEQPKQDEEAPAEATNETAEDNNHPTTIPTTTEVEVSLQQPKAVEEQPKDAASEKKHEEHNNPANTLTTQNSLSWRGFDDSSGGEASGGVYHVSEKYRITQPTKWFRVVMFLLELIFCLIWPAVSLYTVESWQLATVFVAVALMSYLRHYTNAEVLIEEIGEDFAPTPATTKDDKDENTDAQQQQQAWANQSRLSQVAGTISRGKVYQAWRGVFWFFALCFLLLFIQSQSAKIQPTNDTTLTIVRDFEYKPQDSLHYTACDFTKNIKGNVPSTMLDYNFFVMIAYRTENATQKMLDDWYGPGVFQDETEIVEAFRATEENPSPVFYKLFIYDDEEHGRIEGRGQHAIVAVRGSSNAWDWFQNAQLWGSAALLQIVRSVLPFGYMWDPILHDMNDLLTTLQSGTLERLSFYKSTTAFVNHLKASGNYSSIVITGHSLGGGLAIITGAQTQIQAYGISAPNAMISRNRFGITAENLEKYTFNVIPDRDLVPRIDDPSKNRQAIECNAPKNSIFGCHSNKRAFCETMFACGSVGRGFACECATQYEMPIPDRLPGGNRTFEEACGHTREE